MEWARMLAYVTGTVDQELLLRNGWNPQRAALQSKLAYGFIETFGMGCGMVGFGPMAERLGRRGAFLLMHSCALAIAFALQPNSSMSIRGTCFGAIASTPTLPTSSMFRTRSRRRFAMGCDYLLLPKTSFKRSVTRAAGLVLIFFSS